MARLFVTFMEMENAPSGPPLVSPVADAFVAKEIPDTDAYLSLYRSIGEPLQWDERTRMTIRDLAEFLASPSTEIFLLRNQFEPIGLCEFTGIGTSDIELKHFGLVPHVQGNQLGPYLLDFALRSIWDYQPRRVWLHTDSNDHPKARATYARAGFKTYDQRWAEFPD